MTCYAALTTSKSCTAIAAVEILGAKAGNFAAKIFKPANNKKPDFMQGSFYHGQIFSDEQIIDDVVIACQGNDNITINCHGNPLIVKNILAILKGLGVKIIAPEKFLQLKSQNIYQPDTIAIESLMMHPLAKSIDGIKIIMNQSSVGLKKWAQAMLYNVEKTDDVKIRHQSLIVLQNSRIADLLINGIKVVLTGPPNSGKSTLLNCIAGQSKSIVSDIEGTTRDWVSVQCMIKSYFTEFIDTAGISPALAAGGKIDSQSQQAAKQMIKNAHMVLLVLDGTSQSRQWFEHESLWQGILNYDKPILTVLNKADIAKKDSGGLWISALNNDGIDLVIEKMFETLKLPDFDVTLPVCFTDRQIELLGRLTKEKSKQTIAGLLNNLLNQELSI